MIRRAFAAGLAATALVVGAVAVPSVATAANGIADDVSTDVIDSITLTETGGDGVVTLWEQLEAAVVIDSRPDPVDEGDWFSIDFPDELILSDATFQLSQRATPLADCTSEAGVVRCVFNAAAASRQYIEGSFTARVQAAEVTTETDVEFTIGTTGTPIVVGIPGGGIVPVDRGDIPPLKKESWQNAADETELVWVVTVPASAFGAGSTITVGDQIQGAALLTDPMQMSIGYYPDEATWDTDTATWFSVEPGTAMHDLGGGLTMSTTLTPGADRRTFTLGWSEDLRL